MCSTAEGDPTYFPLSHLTLVRDHIYPPYRRSEQMWTILPGSPRKASPFTSPHLSAASHWRAERIRTTRTSSIQRACPITSHILHSRNFHTVINDDEWRRTKKNTCHTSPFKLNMIYVQSNVTMYYMCYYYGLIIIICWWCNNNGTILPYFHQQYTPQ